MSKPEPDPQVVAEVFVELEASDQRIEDAEGILEAERKHHESLVKRLYDLYGSRVYNYRGRVVRTKHDRHGHYILQRAGARVQVYEVGQGDEG